MSFNAKQPDVFKIFFPFFLTGHTKFLCLLQVIIAIKFHYQQRSQKWYRHFSKHLVSNRWTRKRSHAISKQQQFKRIVPFWNMKAPIAWFDPQFLSQTESKKGSNKPTPPPHPVPFVPETPTVTSSQPKLATYAHASLDRVAACAAASPEEALQRWTQMIQEEPGNSELYLERCGMFPLKCTCAAT